MLYFCSAMEFIYIPIKRTVIFTGTLTKCTCIYLHPNVFYLHKHILTVITQVQLGGRCALNGFFFEELVWRLALFMRGGG